VMPHGGWNAPLMLAALAGVVHDRQRASGNERKRDKDKITNGVLIV